MTPCLFSLVPHRVALIRQRSGTIPIKNAVRPTAARMLPLQAIWTLPNRRSSHPTLYRTISHLLAPRMPHMLDHRLRQPQAPVQATGCAMEQAVRPSATGVPHTTMSCQGRMRSGILRRPLLRRPPPTSVLHLWATMKSLRSRRYDVPTAKPLPRPCGAETRMVTIFAMPAVCTISSTAPTAPLACEKR